LKNKIETELRLDFDNTAWVMDPALKHFFRHEADKNKEKAFSSVSAGSGKGFY
jgi:hypothetical protein